MLELLHHCLDSTATNTQRRPLQDNNTDKLVLLRSFKERSSLVVMCSGIAAFMGFMLRGMQEWKPVGLSERIVHLLGVEVFITFGLFAILGVIWGLFAPRWLERLLNKGYQKVITVFCVIGVASILSVAFYLIFY